jgi:hypothetical protein
MVFRTSRAGLHGVSLSHHTPGMRTQCIISSKTVRAKDLAVRRFLASNKIVLRAVTHECQRPPEALRQEAKDFIDFVKPTLTGVNRCERYILNMDQTPIFFTCHRVELSTLQARGQ